MIIGLIKLKFKMKKVVLKICVMFLPCANIIAQIDLKTEFETFIINFDMCQYPYYASWEI